jgi:hypothetical protein
MGALKQPVVRTKSNLAKGKSTPSSDTLERFIARVEQNAHAEAIEEFYTGLASMQENLDPPGVGRLCAYQRTR